MECEKCLDRGFTEEQHGLIMVFCDCEKGRELQAEITRQPEIAVVGPLDELADKCHELIRAAKEEVNDINSGTEPDNRPAGSGDPGKPAKPKKPKAKRKSRRKSG